MHFGCFIASTLFALVLVTSSAKASAGECSIPSPKAGQHFRCGGTCQVEYEVSTDNLILSGASDVKYDYRLQLVSCDTGEAKFTLSDVIPGHTNQTDVTLPTCSPSSAPSSSSPTDVSLQFLIQARTVENSHADSDWVTLCTGASFELSNGTTPAPTTAPSSPAPPPNHSSSPPLWVWPLAGIGCIAVLVFCFGMFNHRGRGRGRGFWSLSRMSEPMMNADRPDRPNPLMHRGHHVLLDPADAHPLHPPARDSLANEWATNSPRTGRWSNFSHGFPSTVCSLSMAERRDSFLRRAENRLSFISKGAVRWVRAMNARSGVVQWIRVDQLVPQPSPSKTPGEGGLAWIQRHDTKGVVWMVRSDDAVLADDFSQIDWQSIAANSFELKARWFRHELEQRLLPPQAEGGPVKFTVQRGCEVEMMSEYFKSMPPSEFHRTFRFRYEGETDFFHDAGGVAREVYSVLVEGLFAPEAGLFAFSDIDNLSYQLVPTPDGMPVEKKLQRLRMAGQVLGKALLDGVTLPVHLSAVLYKHLLRVPVTFPDVMLVDSHVHSSLVYMIENPIQGIFFETFAVDGTPLCEGGENMDVTDANKATYADMYARWLLVGRVEAELFAFCSAFWRIVPEALLSVLDFQELELLMCGLPQLDLSDWKAHTRYGSPLHEGHNLVQWFWEIVSSFDHDEQARLLQFSTGTSNVPVTGFKGLQSTRGKQCLFKLNMVDASLYSLPRAHTCFNTIDLPSYATYEELARCLRLVIDMEAYGFGLDE